MLKRICYILSVITLVSLMAPLPAAMDALAQEEEEINLAAFVPWTEDVWYIAVIEGMTREAEAQGVNIEFYDAGYVVETQVEQFDTAIAKEPDCIILSSVDPHTMIPSVEKARAAGIPVVDYDRPIWDTPLDFLLILDTVDIGRIAARDIVDHLTEKYGEPKGVVIEVLGDLADTWTIDLGGGFHEVIDEYEDIEVIGVESGPWEPEQAAANVEDVLTVRDDVDAMVLHSDWLASGIVAYLEGAGYPPAGEEGHIYFLGVGGMPQGLEYIREGWMDATINNPVISFGKHAVRAAINVVKGEEIPLGPYVEEGAPWSPAQVLKIADYAEESGVTVGYEPTDKDRVLNMPNYVLRGDAVDDPNLWGNVVAEEE